MGECYLHIDNNILAIYGKDSTPTCNAIKVIMTNSANDQYQNYSFQKQPPIVGGCLVLFLCC